ncbi:tRNA lysidine(34) synthetase TilS [Cyanobium sp. FACHB-13342]|uniref:tRNA lysidine(34) synthetase TilS n=1 Tax=Cyanobium sp. FACHB-13342 TaxID=2692793 RepID=UPI0032207DF6
MILPSRGPTAQAPSHQPAQRWGPDHLRLHRHLLRHPELLPAGATLLLALSGGQDSMALLALLHDLGRLHQWSLRLWHGDHRWRPDSSHQAAELERWTASLGLELHIDTWEPPTTQNGRDPRNEAGARQWRYGQLEARARALGATHVVTAHTASDRAETLLLHLARGSHRRGLASLRGQRPLSPAGEDSTPILLTRPLLTFSRADTARLCSQLGLPVWTDPSNSERRFSRNRIRAEVLPVLEELHPGAAQRISAQAERLVEEVNNRDALVDLALQGLGAGGRELALRRPELVRQDAATQRQLLHRWIERLTGQALTARPLEELLPRLQAGQPPGTTALRAGWQLRWDRCTLWLNPPSPHPTQ